MPDRSSPPPPAPGAGPAAGRAGVVPSDFVAGNYFDKYRSRNILHRAMMRGFLRSAGRLVEAARPRRILEVGCGPGDLAWHLLGSGGGPAGPAVDYLGTDVSDREIAAARRRCPGRRFQVASIYDLPLESQSFDLVIACEVFEHLERPDEALREVERVCGAHLLISVPWEPMWRVLNVLRGKYLLHLGNTPGHVQHFSRRGLRQLVGGRFDTLLEDRPFPWTMLLARRRPARPGCPSKREDGRG